MSLKLPSLLSPQSFNFSNCKNFVPLSKTLLTDDHTIFNCPSIRYSIKESFLMSEGCQNDKGDLEFSYVKNWDLIICTRENQDLFHDFLQFCYYFQHKEHSKWAEEMANDAGKELIKQGFTIPESYFYISGHSYPGSMGFAAILENNFFVF